MKKFILGLTATLCFGQMAHAQSSSLNSATSTSSSVAASSLTVSGPHPLLGFTVAAPTPLAAPAFVLVFDATSPPADGVVSPAACYPMSPAAFSGQWTSLSMANTPFGAPVINGIVLVYSTAADCYHKTATTGAFFSVLYQ